MVFILEGLPKDDTERRSMNKAKIWFMNARARRFLESTAIKGVQILERSGWLDNLKAGDIVRFYPEVRAKKLKTMYERNHPLSGIDTASFGRPTEGVTNPKHPNK